LVICKKSTPATTELRPTVSSERVACDESSHSYNTWLACYVR